VQRTVSSDTAAFQLGARGLGLRAPKTRQWPRLAAGLIAYRSLVIFGTLLQTVANHFREKRGEGPARMEKKTCGIRNSAIRLLHPITVEATF